MPTVLPDMQKDARRRRSAGCCTAAEPPAFTSGPLTIIRGGRLVHIRVLASRGSGTTRQFRQTSSEEHRLAVCVGLMSRALREKEKAEPYGFFSVATSGIVVKPMSCATLHSPFTFFHTVT